jgi:BNR repeat-like domain
VTRLRSLLVLAATTAATFAFVVTSAGASPFIADPLVQVSDTSPFDDCTADDVAGQTGTNFPDSEVEPWIDVNPTDQDNDGIVGDNIVGMWQQDRWSNGGARGHGLGVSFDGGTSWEQVVLPNVTVCSEEPGANFGHYQRTTDPWVSFAPDGTLHQISLSFNDIAPPFAPEDEQPGGDFDHALLASKSTDGGLTWSDPEFVIRDLDANVFNDKQSITADPVNAGNVYAVWDRLLFPSSEAASVRSSFTTSAFRGPIWFNRSTDNGDSWEDARQIYDPGQNDQTIASQIVVPPDGTLVNLFAEFNGEQTNKLRAWTVRVLLSNDEGETWSRPIVIDRLQTIAITDPETGDDVRTGDIIPDIAVNEEDGSLYAVWQDARFSDFENDSIAFSQSLDGGLTWSDPIKVNATPTNIAAGNQQAFTASVDVADDGTVAVTYYDFRNNDGAADLKTDYWAVHCHSACGQAQNWGDENRLTDAPFDMRQAPLTTTGFFTGDYEGLASEGNDFLPFFSQTHGGDPSSVFFRRVGP